MKRTLLLLLFSYSLFGQISEINSKLLRTNVWGCVNSSLKDTMILEKDTIELIRYSNIPILKNDKYIIYDTSFHYENKWTVTFSSQGVVKGNSLFAAIGVNVI